MKPCYCLNCKKNTWHKRAFGWGTFFAVLASGGFWIFALPFYPLRCVHCYSPLGQLAMNTEPEKYYCPKCNKLIKNSVIGICTDCGTSLTVQGRINNV